MHVRTNGHAHLPKGTDSDLRIRVRDARGGQRIWADKSLDERIRALKAACKDMLERRHEAIDLAHREIGKPLAEGIFNETLGPLETLAGWSRVVKAHGVREDVRLNPLSFPKKRAYVDLVPRGVIGVIAPWNYPIAGLYRSVFPALLTGNAVVLKPSEHTPRTSSWFIDRLAAHVPESVVQSIVGGGEVGSALLESGIDACVFTGSTKTGRLVRTKCAELGIPASIEMGGKDPAIVLADCDQPRTVAGLTHWALSNAGQACGAIEIAFVDERIAEDLIRRLRQAWEKLRVGTRCAPDVDLGPLAIEKQLAVVEAHVADALAKGAKLICGGKRSGDGLGYLPTILDRCDERMAVVREETFGPVLAIVRIASTSEGIERANALEYGLGASIWTADTARAERLAERLQYGVVCINNHALTGAMPELPWSGTRATGTGIANGRHALSTFVRPRAVLVDESHSPEMFWMPYDEELVETGNLLAEAQLGRILGAWKLPLLLRRRVQTVKRFFGFR
jgi:succinate-semialdehyde dehydrogenase/glutarate-semialdehyde dehydrogenase